MTESGSCAAPRLLCYAATLPSVATTTTLAAICPHCHNSTPSLPLPLPVLPSGCCSSGCTSSTCPPPLVHLSSIAPCPRSFPLLPHATHTRLLFKWLHKQHVPPYVEVSAVLAGSYTVYLCTGKGVRSGGDNAVEAAGAAPAHAFIPLSAAPLLNMQHWHMWAAPLLWLCGPVPPAANSFAQQWGWCHSALLGVLHAW